MGGREFPETLENVLKSMSNRKRAVIKNKGQATKH